MIDMSLIREAMERRAGGEVVPAINQVSTTTQGNAISQQPPQNVRRPQVSMNSMQPRMVGKQASNYQAPPQMSPEQSQALVQQLFSIGQ